MKAIKKTYQIKAEPADVYTALTTPLSIEIWTGSAAVMDTVAGSEFSLWDGDICGRNLEFETNRKIVQQWYFDGEEEQSVVTIQMNPSKGGTEIQLLHIGIPDEAFDNILEGWDHSYFGPLKTLLEE